MNANLAEIYILFKNPDSDEQIHHLQSLTREDQECLIVYYLKIIGFLLEEENGKAKKVIKEMLKFILEKPTSHEKFYWRFDELKSSPRYVNLTASGEARKIITNLINFLSRRMNDTQKARFESGEYASLSKN